MLGEGILIFLGTNTGHELNSIGSLKVLSINIILL